MNFNSNLKIYLLNILNTITHKGNICSDFINKNIIIAYFFSTIMFTIIYLSPELLIKQWHIIIILSLIEVASNRISQFVFKCKFSNREFLTLFARPKKNVIFDYKNILFITYTLHNTLPIC